MNKLSLTAIAAIASFSFPLSALALDPQDFADKLASSVSVSAGYEVTFKNATVNGNVITLSGLSVPQFEDNKATQIFDTPIVFFGVKETGDGGYSAKSARFEDIDFTDDEINVKVNDITFSNIRIPANAEEDILATAMLYENFSVGKISISNDGEELFSVKSINATNKANNDKTEFVSTFNIEGIFSDLSKIPDEDARVGLAAVGLTTIEGRVDADATWTLADGRIKVDEFILDFDNIGRLSMGMDFSGYTLEVLQQIMNINKELVTIDPSSSEYEAKSMEMMMSMAARLSLNEVSVNFEDDGITNKILNLVTAQQGTNKKEMIAGLSMMIPMFLSSFELPELQSQIEEAVDAYLSDPKNIEIKVKPENSTPIMAFVALANNPPALLVLLNISILANQ